MIGRIVIYQLFLVLFSHGIHQLTDNLKPKEFIIAITE